MSLKPLTTLIVAALSGAATGLFVWGAAQGGIAAAGGLACAIMASLFAIYALILAVAFAVGLAHEQLEKEKQHPSGFVSIRQADAWVTERVEAEIAKRDRCERKLGRMG